MDIADRVAKRVAAQESKVGWTVQKIVDAAKAAGFTVKETSSGSIQIYKTHKGYGHIIKGIERWPNRTWTRMDIDLSVATAIRKLDDVADVLGLKQARSSHRRP